MGLRSELHDRVTLVKENGDRFENVRASVQSDTIFTDDPKLPIEEGDRFERKLPSGSIESYVVVDRGFMQGSSGIESHYQSKVRKQEAMHSQGSQEKPMLKLFLSHSSEDINIVTPLVDLLQSGLNLRAEEIRCTSVDGYRLAGGAVTETQLRKELNNAQAFISVISDTSIRSMYVMFELGARWGTEKPLLPVLAPGTDASILDGPLSGINALASDNRAQLHQLVTDLAGVLDVEAEPPAAIQKKIDAVLEAAKRRVIPSERAHKEQDPTAPTDANSIARMPTLSNKQEDVSHAASDAINRIIDSKTSGSRLAKWKQEVFLELFEGIQGLPEDRRIPRLTSRLREMVKKDERWEESSQKSERNDPKCFSTTDLDDPATVAASARTVMMVNDVMADNRLLHRTRRELLEDIEAFARKTTSYERVAEHVRTTLLS